MVFPVSVWNFSPTCESGSLDSSFKSKLTHPFWDPRPQTLSVPSCVCQSISHAALHLPVFMSGFSRPSALWRHGVFGVPVCTSASSWVPWASTLSAPWTLEWLLGLVSQVPFRGVLHVTLKGQSLQTLRRFSFPHHCGQISSECYLFWHFTSLVSKRIFFNLWSLLGHWTLWKKWPWTAWGSPSSQNPYFSAEGDRLLAPVSWSWWLPLEFYLLSCLSAGPAEASQQAGCGVKKPVGSGTVLDRISNWQSNCFP